MRCVSFYGLPGPCTSSCVLGTVSVCMCSRGHLAVCLTACYAKALATQESRCRAGHVLIAQSSANWFLASPLSAFLWCLVVFMHSPAANRGDQKVVCCLVTAGQGHHARRPGTQCGQCVQLKTVHTCWLAVAGCLCAVYVIQFRSHNVYDVCVCGHDGARVDGSCLLPQMCVLSGANCDLAAVSAQPQHGMRQLCPVCLLPQ